MAKKNAARIPKRTPEEVALLSDGEKLRLLKYLEQEIDATKAKLKDQQDAAKEYIEEVRAQQKELLEDIEPERVEGSVQSFAPPFEAELPES